jgi:DNA-binding protein Fis
MGGSMKKSRKFNRSLGTYFDRSAEPIYLVSADRQIVYMNNACLAWVGLDADHTDDLQCFFTSEDTIEPKDDPVKGLCPPPELFSDSHDDGTLFDQTQSIAGPITTSVFVSLPKGTETRPATFHRLLNEEQQLLGVLGVVSANCESNSSEPNATSADPSASSQSQALHTALAMLRQHHADNYAMGNLIGTSPFADRLRRQTAAIIGLDAETVITGPPGSGREHLARTIAASGTDSEDFSVAVLHCVLADDELTQQSIDQVANQITKRTRRGRAVPVPSDQQTHPILLLLDIDKLTGSALLLVESFLKRSGDACRVIATSETSLVELATQNKFPAGIAHQLTTIEVPLISLAQRREDIPLMAQAFVEHANRSREHQLGGFDDASMQLLNEFHWPGNLEQLQQLVTAACDHATGSKIQVADLPDSFRHAVQAFRIGDPEETTIDLTQWIEQLELELIQRALLQSKGNKTKAAQLLSISRSRLIRRMGHFGLSASTEEKTKRKAKGKNSPSDQSTPDDTPPTESDNQMIDPSAFEELE